MEFMLDLYFREIVYHNPSGRKDSVCGVFSYEAMTIEELRLGNLYLAGKISNFSPKQHKNYDFLLGVLTSVIKREFYSDPLRSTTEALESALQSANIYLEDFAKKGHKEWIGNLDFTCFAFSENNIHIGQTGDMLIYLFRRGSMTNIAKKFVKKEKPKKPFANIATGSLEENDKVIITTPDIAEIGTTNKLKELISYPSSEKIYEFIKQGLKKTSSLACLILEAKAKSPIKKEKAVPKENIKRINLDLERILNSQSNKFNNIIKSKTNGSKIINSLLKYNTPKYLIFFLLFLIIVLSPYLIQKINYESKLGHIDNLIKRIKQITSKSELALIYQNQIDAQAFLQQASALTINASGILNQLPELVQKESKKILESVQTELDGQTNSINNVVNIEEPEIIADLEKNSFSFNPKGILKLENFLYLYEITSGFIYKIDLNDLNNPTLVFLSSKDTFKLGEIKENAIVLLSDPEKIYVYGKNDNYNTYLIKPNLENTLYIKDIAQYDNNLYFLNTQKLDILKYVPQDNSLATFAPLLKKEDGLIDWTLPAENIAALIRGVCVWPGAYTFCKDKRLKIYRAEGVDMKTDASPGTVIERFPDELSVATGKGVLSILEIQGPSGKRLLTKDFLRGFKIPAGEVFSSS